MTIKSMSSFVAIPFLALTSLGIASSAKAAVLEYGSTLNISGALQVFGPPETGSNLFANPGSILPGTDAIPAISDTTCVVGSEACDVFVTSTTGSFDAIDIGLNEEAIISFTPSVPGVLDDVLVLGDFSFGIDRDSIVIEAVDAINGNFTFEAVGFVEFMGEFAKVNYTGFSANGLLDDGILGGDVVAGDGFSGVGSYSGTIFLVPEPLTIMGAGMAAGFGAFFKRKCSSKEKT